jgi:hypothetical protein
MKEERVKIVKPPEPTLLNDSKGVVGANALCGCKDVCVSV